MQRFSRRLGIAALSTALVAGAFGIIYATAIEHGWSLITKDRKLLEHRHPKRIAIW